MMRWSRLYGCQHFCLSVEPFQPARAEGDSCRPPIGQATQHLRKERRPFPQRGCWAPGPFPQLTHLVRGQEEKEEGAGREIQMFHPHFLCLGECVPPQKYKKCCIVCNWLKYSILDNIIDLPVLGHILEVRLVNPKRNKYFGIAGGT